MQTYQVFLMENFTFKLQICFKISCCFRLPSKRICLLVMVTLKFNFYRLRRSYYYLLPSKQIYLLAKETLRFSFYFKKSYYCRLPSTRTFRHVMEILESDSFHPDYFPMPFKQIYQLAMEILPLSFYFKKSFCCLLPSRRTFQLVKVILKSDSILSFYRSILINYSRPFEKIFPLTMGIPHLLLKTAPYV